MKIKLSLSLMKLYLLKTALRLNSRPTLMNLIKNLNKIIKNQNIFKKWLLSTQKHHTSQKLLKWSTKYQSRFHQNYLLLKLLHPLTRILTSLVSTTDLKKKHSNHNQHLKIPFMISSSIIWKVSPPLPWTYQLSHTLTKNLSAYY